MQTLGLGFKHAIIYVLVGLVLDEGAVFGNRQTQRDSVCDLSLGHNFPVIAATKAPIVRKGILAGRRK